jgi:outer membrane protein assembly factor BamB
MDAYKGDIEQYYPPLAILTRTPVCQAEEIPGPLDFPQCGQIDIDFGASPNLFTDSHGREIVGDLQKSGVYHAAYTDNMQKAWSTPVGTPCALCNAATAAVDDVAVYAVGTLGGQLVSMDKTTGTYNWIAPVADGVHYEAVSVANGTVYIVDTKGLLQAFDAATGLPLGGRPMALDTADACVSLGASAAIARERVYGVCDTAASGTSWIVAYGR